MKRDGASVSLWQETTPDYKSRNNVSSNFYDVIIAGGGITGISLGFLLQKSGKSVLIAEARSIGFGTTGGTTAHLNTFPDTSYNILQSKFGEKDTRMVADAMRNAISLIKKNVREYQIDCGFKELPGYLFSQDEKQSGELEKIFEASKEVGVEVGWSETIPVPIPFEKALVFPGQATFHPTRYLTALANAFENEGGVILQECRVTGVEEGEPHRVHCSSGDFECTHFVYATHIPPGVNLLHFRCAPYRSYAMAVKLEDNQQYPEALVYDMYDPYHYYRTQEIDGKMYFIAGGEDHKTGHEENTENCFRKLHAYINQYFQVSSVENKWSSQFFEPNDGLPYIGHLPGHNDNMWVATGYGGNGMTYSSAAAILLSNLILNGEHEWVELFDPNRVKMVAGFSNFVKESADVIGTLVKRVVPAEKLNELAELAPGEAMIANYEGERLALYKDENGLIYALSTACTHIKCEVSWNAAEKSWDCPCHGSRFSFTGEMVTAPARKDLEKVEILTEEKVANYDK